MSKKKVILSIKEGDKHLLYFISIFIFVHIIIIIPYKHDVENNVIGQTRKTIESQMAYLNRKLTKFKDDAMNADYAQEKMDSIRTQSYLLREKLVVYQKAYIEIDNQKVERSFTIPILGITLARSVVLSTYPAFILIGLCLALVHRRKLLMAMDRLPEAKKNDLTLPIWAAPVPYYIRNNSHRDWLYVNTIGLSVHLLLIFLGLDFIFFEGNKFNAEILAVNIAIAIVATVVYVKAIYHLIMLEWRRTEK